MSLKRPHGPEGGHANSDEEPAAAQPFGVEDVRASSAAQFAAALVPALPQATCDALYILLGHGIASPSSTELREQQLGLIYELIERQQGQLPSVRDYLDERQTRQHSAETWPTPSQLAAAYGSWQKVCAAGFRLWEEGSRGRVPHTYQHAKQDYALYRRQHVVEAIHRFRVKFGHWPTQWEYEEWARLQRRAARLTGQDDPRLPTLPRITKLCSSWDRALALAVRAW